VHLGLVDRDADPDRGSERLLLGSRARIGIRFHRSTGALEQSQRAQRMA